MKIIAHISDLHFGREDPAIVDALHARLQHLGPDLVAVSGDLTQRARRAEFKRARQFLEGLQLPLLVVPGNHDIPFYDFARRFLQPLRRYRRYITDDLTPFHHDDEVAVLGLNTARSLTFKDGRLSLLQIALIGKRFKDVRDDVHKVLVTHHSFIRPQADPRAALVGRAPLALAALRRAGVRLLLAGHFHQGFSGDVRSVHRRFRKSILVAQAGTAVSRRRRGEPNAFNLLRVGPERVDLDVEAFDGRRFAPTATSRFSWREDEWRRLDT